MKLFLPDQKLLKRTSDVDYVHWNYQFPIKYVQRYRFKAILKLMDNRMYDKVLEIGTGSGVFLPELSKHCQELHACDVHDHFDAVDDLCKFYSLSVNLERSSIQSNSYSDEFFDVIIAISVLEFVKNLRKSIEEIKRILKPRGLFLTICPQKNSLIDLVLGLYTRKKPEEEFMQSRKEVKRMLETSFNVDEKRVYPSLLGSLLPVYYSYRLTK